MAKELVTVALPVYNGMPFLPACVDSILAQTLKNFRLLIIDDGSTDDSANYLESVKDSRIVVIHQENRGLGTTLNRASELCETKYMARMDADDVIAPSRLQEQLEYIEQHEDVVMLGTQLAFITGNSVIKTLKVPLEHDAIDRRLLSGSGGVCHASLMLRTEAVRAIRGYRIRCAGQAYDFCLRLCEIGRAANLDLVLYYYRIHENSLAQNNQDEIRQSYAYAIECAKCRRQSLDEPNFEAFVQSCDRRNGLTKILNKLEDWSIWQYRQSILDKGHGRILRSVARLFCAAAVRPRYSMKKLLNK